MILEMVHCWYLITSIYHASGSGCLPSNQSIGYWIWNECGVQFVLLTVQPATEKDSLDSSELVKDGGNIGRAI